MLFGLGTASLQQQLDNNYLIVIWLYLARNRTPTIDCYRVGGSTQSLDITYIGLLGSLWRGLGFLEKCNPLRLSLRNGLPTFFPAGGSGLGIQSVLRFLLTKTESGGRRRSCGVWEQCDVEIV